MQTLFKSHLEKTASEIDNFLRDYFYNKSIMDEIFIYALLNGGKRFRPALVTAFSENSKSDYFIKAGAAIEVIHSFSLVHDDLPCLDNDDIRRGNPSCHKKFGESQAMLAGDGMSFAAFSILSSIENNELSLALIKELSDSAFKMVEGQYMEINSNSINESCLQKIHSLKTGALIISALRMGGIISGKNDLKTITEYGKNLGLLFQLTDDLLDFDNNEKCNFVTVSGKEKTLRIIDEVSNEALKLAGKLDNQLLISAVDFLQKRSY